MEHFQSIPWVASILAQPGTITFIPSSRQPQNSKGSAVSKDVLLGHSLNSPESIPHYIGFYQDPFSSSTSTSQTKSKGQHFFFDSTTLIFDLHSGVNGFNGTVHGGLISVLFDEAMGNLMFMNHEMYKAIRKEGRTIPTDVMDFGGIAMFTASMNVRLQRPIATPQIVLVSSTLNRIEGRKVFLDTEVRSKEGVVFAKCEGMWMSVPIKGKI
jgi:acyl-coenzyme A thioesterase PaaI-like protein